MYDIHNIPKRLEKFDSSLFQEAFRRQQQLKDPVDLSVGLPGGPTPQYIKDAGIKAIQEDHTVYTPANGIPELRRAIAEKLAKENALVADESSVTVVPGLTAGMLITYLALLNPGEEVLVMDPCYPSYHYLVPLADGILKRIPTLHNFQLDFTAIERSITPKSRMIIVNTPNNPTGAVYPKEDLMRLAEIAKEHDLLIVSDEMYESFVYEGEHFSIGSIYPNTLTMNGFSKAYSMTGWRLGYIHGPQQLISQINSLQQYAIFSSSSIAQYAALAALSQPTLPRDSYVQKRQLINTELRALGYDIQGNDGAYYTFFKVPHGLTDIEFINKAADNNLLLLPGRAFSQEENYVRLSYGGRIEDVEQGLAIIKKITEEAKYQK
jgi:aspartate/methionine/tyrosine aminotransferase